VVAGGWLLDGRGLYIPIDSNINIKRFCIHSQKHDIRRLVDSDAPSGALLSALGVDLIPVGIVVCQLLGDTLLFLLSILFLHGRLMTLLVGAGVVRIIFGRHGWGIFIYHVSK